MYGQLINFVLTGMYKQMHTGIILLVDLQKLSDTLGYGVLLKKHEMFWFPEICNEMVLYLCFF